MVDAVPAMHIDFPRWHAAVAVGADTEHRDARWAAVHALSESADRPTVEALVRLAFDTKRQPPSSRYLEKIHETFRQADGTFHPKRASGELPVFAGACLSLLFEKPSQIGAVAALSVTTAAFVGARAPNLPLDLVEMAEEALVRIADANRARPTLTTAMGMPKVDVEAAVARIRSEFNAEAVAQALSLTAKWLDGAQNAFAQGHARAIQAIDRFIRVQDEELQMLWWLTGGRSFDLDCAFDMVEAAARPLVFAKELSDSTTSLPGPRSIKALLVRAGLEQRTVRTVAAVINAARPDWLLDLPGDDPSPVTRPVHFAIKRQAEAGGGETWVPNWSAVVGVDGGREVSEVSLGLQFYRERLITQFE